MWHRRTLLGAATAAPQDAPATVLDTATAPCGTTKHSLALFLLLLVEQQVPQRSHIVSTIWGHWRRRRHFAWSARQCRNYFEFFALTFLPGPLVGASGGTGRSCALLLRLQEPQSLLQRSWALQLLLLAPQNAPATLLGAATAACGNTERSWALCLLLQEQQDTPATLQS